jgi:hypothetical protein
MWLIDNATENEFVFELGTLSDRLAGLLVSVLLDQRLEAALRARWQDDGDVLRDLFRDGAPLGSFGARVQVGFAIGMYGKDTYEDLRQINKIRNSFAHKLEAKDFAFQSVRDRIAKLKLPAAYPVTKPLIQNDAEVKDFLLGKTHWTDIEEYTKHLAQHSSVEDIDQPRGKFLRTVELLLIFLTSERWFAQMTNTATKPHF